MFVVQVTQQRPGPDGKVETVFGFLSQDGELVSHHAAGQFSLEQAVQHIQALEYKEWYVVTAVLLRNTF